VAKLASSPQPQATMRLIGCHGSSAGFGRIAPSTAGRTVLCNQSGFRPTVSKKQQGKQQSQQPVKRREDQVEGDLVDLDGEFGSFCCLSLFLDHNLAPSYTGLLSDPKSLRATREALLQGLSRQPGAAKEQGQPSGGQERQAPRERRQDSDRQAGEPRERRKPKEGGSRSRDSPQQRTSSDRRDKERQGGGFNRERESGSDRGRPGSTRWPREEVEVRSGVVAAGTR
jgi:hypothetical protein